MKKILVILIVALVVLTSASAFRFKSVGFEVSTGYYVVADMEIIDNLDVYAGIGYAGGFGITSGVQYKVASFEIGETDVAVRPGVKIDTLIGDGYTNFILLGTCAFSFETDSLTAFLRPGLGVSLSPQKSTSGTAIYTAFAFSIDAGVAYLFQ